MHIGHVALRVRDPDMYAAFAIRTLGLREVGRTDLAILLSASEKHHELELLRGETNEFGHIGLEVESAQTLHALRGALERSGIGCDGLSEAESVGLGEAFRFTGPGAIVHEVYTGMLREPVSMSRHTQHPVRRLGHVTVASAVSAELERLWVDVLGFRVSDRLGRAVWLRCDADHHGIAIAPKSEGTVLHHHAWEAQDLVTLGSYCDQLIELDMALIWGPVRHGPGFNVATYLPDPAGGLVEVYTDLLQIVDDTAYIPQDWTGRPNALSLWGSPVPQEFLGFGLPTAAARAA